MIPTSLAANFDVDSVLANRHTSTMANLQLVAPLQYVKGVGPRKAEVLAQHGLRTVWDLLHYYPRQYLDRTDIVPIGSVKIDQPVTIIGEVKAHGLLHGKRRRYEVILQDDSGAITLLWFGGLRYWERLFKRGQKYAATGTVSYFMGNQMIHPEIERLEEDTDRLVHAGRIIPVYPQTSDLNAVGLSSRGIRRVTTFVFDHLAERLDDPIPVPDRQALSIPSLHQAVTAIHYPASRDDIEAGRRRLAFDELLTFQFLVFRNKSRKAAVTKPHRYQPPGEILRAFKARLPFELTSGQRRAVKGIFDDLQSARPMARLLQGDVGCGKTIVAIAAALYAAENSLQAAFMAPTEILAEQHYRTWREELDATGVKSAMLTSSLRATQKKATAQRCAEGEVGLLFGTHALIYDYVTFRRLGLVVIDEQHRFGVEQRGKLHAKGDEPDLLVMTATPIPRTLAMTLYGDLDVSTIDTLPPGRKPVRTAWRTLEARDKVYEYVREEVSRGGQAYVVFPIIERSEQGLMQSVQDAFEQLTRGAFRDLRVGAVHGRIKAKDRDETLRRFRDGELDILLSTTVIEVGIDNPNATLMVVEHAERFGLAQLHQLRGRIGRGDKQASFVAIAHPPLSEIGRKRLEYFAGTTDGFDIAEADLEMRGPGELFGLRQSGAPEFRVTRLASDRDLIEGARRLLTKLFSGVEKLDKPYRKLYSSLQQAASRKGAGWGGG